MKTDNEWQDLGWTTTDLPDARGATVDILDYVPRAQRVTAGVLRKGDRLFDSMGGTHEISRTPEHSPRGWVTTTRADGWQDRFHHTATVTIIRAAGVDEAVESD